MDQAFVIRAATLEDLDWLDSVANGLGIGFTSLPNNKEFLKNRLTQVEKSFKQNIPIQERVYLFFRENLPQKQIVGISGIDVNVGYQESFYNYQVSTVVQISKALNIRVEHKMLNLVNNYQEATELISFWVDPAARGQECGKSLSFARFLFMAHFPNWFNETVISEVRGYFDSDEKSPFWEAVGKNFYGMSFREADELTFGSGKQFISDLVSRDPIYLDLLPQAAQDVIGLENADSRPAIKLLEQQGFKFSNHVDIFDAGPLMSADRNSIKAVQDSKNAKVAKIAPCKEGKKALLFNNNVEARFTVADISELEDDDISISRETADILRTKTGDVVRYYYL